MKVLSGDSTWVCWSDVFRIEFVGAEYSRLSLY